VATIAIVFVMALLHEFAHVWAAVNLGGRVRQLLVTPWGGPSELVLPPQPKAQLIVHCAGPFLHMMIFATGALLLILAGNKSIWELINPLKPLPVVAGHVDISLIGITTWVNFQMLVVNLIPAPPFDGSRIVRSAARSFDPEIPELRLETAILGSGIGSGLALFAVAWVVRDINEGPIQPTWFLLVCAGIMLIFSSRHGFHQWSSRQSNDFSMLDELMKYETMEHEGFDAASDYEDDEDSIVEWMGDQLAGTEMAERSVAIEEERRVDVILEKLHRHGMKALSEDERTFLERISQQYRRRRETQR
jgi:Zn-dependent protease